MPHRVTVTRPRSVDDPPAASDDQATSLSHAGAKVVGVDACRAGWVGVALHHENVTVQFAPTIAELVAEIEKLGHLAVVGIDIPIGLPDNAYRDADLLAYSRLGPRRSSVFMTPVRAALEAADHAAATMTNKARTGKGISVQAYGLRTRIFEVDTWARHAKAKVVEVHPELSFAALAGSPLPDGKRTWTGAHHRRQLLLDAGIDLPDDLGEAGRRAAIDDVLDAGAAAWTARRVAARAEQRLPNPPVVHSDGWPAAISV